MNNQLKNLINKKYRLEYINYNKIINAYSNHYLNQNINNVIVLKSKINKKKITEKQQQKRKNQIEKLQNQKNIKSIIDENILNQINGLIENLNNDFNLKIMVVRKEIRNIIKQYKESLRIKKLASKKKISDEQAKIIIIERNEKAKQKRLLKKQSLQNQNIQVAPIENIEIIPIEIIEILPIEIIEVVNIEKKAIVQIKKIEVANIEVEDEEEVPNAGEEEHRPTVARAAAGVDLSKNSNFPAKLHAILSNPGYQHIICWMVSSISMIFIIIVPYSYTSSVSLVLFFISHRHNQ